MYSRCVPRFKLRECNAKTYYFNFVLRPFSTWEDRLSPELELNESYLCDPSNKSEIQSNIDRRKGVGDINKVHQLYSEPKTEDNRRLLIKELLKIPNHTHPDVVAYNETPKLVKLIGDKKQFDYDPKQFHSLAKSMNLLKNDTSSFTGHRSYFFIGQLAQLEMALIKYSMQKLIKKGFQVLSVPDVLPRSVIESCGLETRGSRSHVSPKHPLYI